MTFSGLKVLQNKVERAKGRLGKDIIGYLDQEATYIQSRSVSNAPVDTGYLKSSQYKIVSVTRSNKVYKIGFGAKYSPYQEFGTGNKYTKNAEYREFDSFASQFKTGKNPNRAVRPRRYFLHYYIISRRSLSRKISTLIKNLFK